MGWKFSDEVKGKAVGLTRDHVLATSAFSLGSSTRQGRDDRLSAQMAGSDGRETSHDALGSLVEY